MNVFCKPIGIHAPNTRFKSTSCYTIKLKYKLIILDIGLGVKDKIIKYILSNNILPENIVIIISHNHLDHVAGINGIGKFMLDFYPNSKIKLLISNTCEKYYDWYSNILRKFGSVFDVLVIDENLMFTLEDLDISFCRTNHCKDKLKSFATKISDGYNSFVYTSDIASVDNNLKKFTKNCNLVMVEAGNPIKRFSSLEGYHGITNDTVCNLLDVGVGNIYLTHLKGIFKAEDYINSIDYKTHSFVNVIEKGEAFNIFTAEKIQTYITKEIRVLA